VKDVNAGPNVEVVTEEQLTYAYGISVSLEPGEAAPDFAKHEDVEVADSGWDKIDRVNRIAYTTINQDVAQEHGFALLGTEDNISCSWGTFDCSQIEMGEYQYEGDIDVDIYTDEGAEDALRFANEVGEEHAAEQAKRDAVQKTAEAARDERLAILLKDAGIEPTPWALNIALQAGYYVRNMAHWQQGKFSKTYSHQLFSKYEQTSSTFEPGLASGAPKELQQAHAVAYQLVSTAQQQARQLILNAKNKIHAQAARILDVVRANDVEVLGLLEQVRLAMVSQ
jgi:hypothetical protein